MNYYKIYQKNIWFLINLYQLNYFWININLENFYNGTENPYNDFDIGDQELNQYLNQKYKLGLDILKRGTFTPFFYYKKENKKYIFLGKHRLYSLKLVVLLKNQIILPNFLFIEIPEQMIVKNFSKLTMIPENSPNLYSHKNDLIWRLGQDGDFLSFWLYENNCTPFLPFNDEKLFEEWLNTPIEELYGDIDI